MATKKQTLKSLFGGSDSREQVELNLGQVNLGNRVQTAGQYGVAVQQTPKTNAALQFAEGLNQFSKTASAFARNQKNEAIDEVQYMSDDELANAIAGGDKGIFNVFKKNKQYNYELVRQKALRAKPTIEQAYNDFALNLESSPDNFDFDAGLTGLKEDLNQEIFGELTNDYQKNAHQAITGVLFSDYEISATNTYAKLKATAGKHLKEQNDFMAIAQFQSKQVGDAVNVMDATTSFNRFQKQLPQLFPDFEDRAGALVTFGTNLVSHYTGLDNPNWTEALEVIDTMENHEFYKGAKLYNVGDNAKDINSLKEKILKDKAEYLKQDPIDISQADMALSQELSQHFGTKVFDVKSAITTVNGYLDDSLIYLRDQGLRKDEKAINAFGDSAIAQGKRFLQNGNVKAAQDWVEKVLPEIGVGGAKLYDVSDDFVTKVGQLQNSIELALNSSSEEEENFIVEKGRIFAASGSNTMSRITAHTSYPELQENENDKAAVYKMWRDLNPALTTEDIDERMLSVMGGSPNMFADKLADALQTEANNGSFDMQNIHSRAKTVLAEALDRIAEGGGRRAKIAEGQRLERIQKNFDQEVRENPDLTLEQVVRKLNGGKDNFEAVTAMEARFNELQDRELWYIKTNDYDKEEKNLETTLVSRVVGIENPSDYNRPKVNRSISDFFEGNRAMFENEFEARVAEASIRLANEGNNTQTAMATEMKAIMSNLTQDLNERYNAHKRSDEIYSEINRDTSLRNISNLNLVDKGSDEMSNFEKKVSSVNPETKKTLDGNARIYPSLSMLDPSNVEQIATDQRKMIDNGQESAFGMSLVFYGLMPSKEGGIQSTYKAGEAPFAEKDMRIGAYLSKLGLNPYEVALSNNTQDIDNKADEFINVLEKINSYQLLNEEEEEIEAQLNDLNLTSIRRVSEWQEVQNSLINFNQQN